MSGNAQYPPVTVPGTVHALRHLPFSPGFTRGEFHALAAFHLGQIETEEDADLLLDSFAIRNGYRYVDTFVANEFFKEFRDAGEE